MSKTDPLVVVLSGGVSHERSVSLLSAETVVSALCEAGFQVVVLEPDAKLIPRLQELKPDVIFPVLHGAVGEDGTLLSLLQSLNFKYVAARPEAARLSWNKPLANDRAAEAGLRVPTSVALSQDLFRDLGPQVLADFIASTIPGELVVKPARGGSAQGLSLLSKTADLPQALLLAYQFCPEALVSERIHGTEVAVCIIDFGKGPEVLPIVEIVPSHGTYGFEARYIPGETTFFAPARLDAKLNDRVVAAALSAYQVLSLSVMARIDFIIDKDQEIFFLEANVILGQTATSLMPLAIRAAGSNAAAVYSELISAIL